VTALTEVELYWLEGKVERWIRFGRASDDRILDRRRRVLGFKPGVVFAFVRWASNDYGTVVSRIDILRAVERGRACSTVPCVTPGGEILLRSFGWPKVERVLKAIDAVEAIGVDSEDADPNHWRHVHNRIAASLEPRAYTRERHRAWLMRQEIEA
jgi:hypothetical protein